MLFNDTRSLQKLKTVMNTVPRHNLDHTSKLKLWFADGHKDGRCAEANCRLLVKLMDAELKVNGLAYSVCRLTSMDNERPTLEAPFVDLQRSYVNA